MPSENRLWPENVFPVLVSDSLRGIAFPNVIFETLVLMSGGFGKVLLALIVVTEVHFDSAIDCKNIKRNPKYLELTVPYASSTRILTASVTLLAAM